MAIWTNSCRGLQSMAIRRAGTSEEVTASEFLILNDFCEASGDAGFFNVRTSTDTKTPSARYTSSILIFLDLSWISTSKGNNLETFGI